MKKLFVLGFFALSACTAFANLMIVQEVETIPSAGGEKTKSSVVMSARGGKYKIEFGAGHHVLIDIAAGKLWMVDDANRMATAMDINQLKQMADAMHQASESKGSRWEVKGSDKIRTIDGYKCREYAISSSGATPSTRGVYWTTEDIDIKDLDALKDLIKDMGNVLGMDALSKISGLPVESDVSYTSGQNKVRAITRLKSVSRDELPDTVFALPEGYTVVE